MSGIQPMSSPTWGAQSMYADPTGYLQHQSWLNTLPGMGIPQQWGTYTGGIEEYINARQGMENVNATSNALANRLTEMQKEYDLKQQSFNDVWSKVSPMLGGLTSGGGLGGGGNSPISTAISSAEMNPLRLQGEEARRRIYASGGSKRYRQSQLASEAGSEQSAIAQAIAGGRSAASLQQTGVFDALMRLFGQMIP